MRGGGDGGGHAGGDGGERRGGCWEVKPQKFWCIQTHESEATQHKTATTVSNTS